MVCEYEDCQNEAAVLLAVLDDEGEISVCFHCLSKLSQRFLEVLDQRNALMAQGVSESMANHIMNARVERQEA